MKNQMMGEYNHTMDAKGRLIVPAKFREAGGDRFVVTKGLEECLFLFTEEKWDSVVESISHMPLTHKNARAFSRFFIGSAGECESWWESGAGWRSGTGLPGRKPATTRASKSWRKDWKS